MTKRSCTIYDQNMLCYVTEKERKMWLMKETKMMQTDETAIRVTPLFGWHKGEQIDGSKMKYADTLFGACFVHQINIKIDAEDWEDLVKHPTDKTRYDVDVTIDGETLKKVVISTKGVSSLVFPSLKKGNQRYSFKLQFGKHKKKQTYHGLDKLDLNCCFCDATLMKDYISYRFFHLASVPAPLAAYAWVTVNGEDLGLYLIVEKTEESFLKRNFGKGVLYKPCTSDMGMGVEEAQYLTEIGSSEIYISEETQGADFAYVDDDPASYPGILNNRKTDGGKKDGRDCITENVMEGRKPRKRS